MTTFPITRANSIEQKYSVYSSALQRKKVQSSIEKFHWSKKLRKTENFIFQSKYKSTACKRQLISICFFVSKGHFDNGTLRKVTYNLSVKNSQHFGADNLPCEIRKILPYPHFFTCNRLTVTMFKIFMLSTVKYLIFIYMLTYSVKGHLSI